MTDPDLDARLVTLEMRAMHQDTMIEDLNATITAQWRILDRLARQVATIDERLRESVGSVPSETAPPHY